MTDDDCPDPVAFGHAPHCPAGGAHQGDDLGPCPGPDCAIQHASPWAAEIIRAHAGTPRTRIATTAGATP